MQPSDSKEAGGSWPVGEENLELEWNSADSAEAQASRLASSSGSSAGSALHEDGQCYLSTAEY